MSCPTPQPSLWSRLKTRFKQWQKSYNDLIFTPLAILLFLQLPTIWNRIYHDDEMHGFATDSLMALPLALVMFCFASLCSYGMFKAQYPDLYDEHIRCNEQDLLKKVVSTDSVQLLDTAHFITPLQYRQAWRIHSESRSILSHYFWALVLIEVIIAATIPSAG